jgi:NADH-quinone oxidoreductase subunit I
MYCGICIEVCPFDALLWSPEHDYPGDGPAALVHEREQLRAWVQAVPPPEPDDPRGDAPSEVVVADRAAARSATGERARPG